MDISKHSSQEAIENMIGMYKKKYDVTNIDLLITFGPRAYSILRSNGFEAIQTSPVINIDIADNIFSEDGELIFYETNSLHIPIESDYVMTLKTAFELFPDYKDVYIISGYSSTDRYFAELIRKASIPFNESHYFTFLQGSNLDSTMAIVQNISETSIVFVTSFLEDAQGIPYSTSIVTQIIEKNIPAPLFTLSDDFINSGAVGGYVYSFTELGKDVDNIIIEVLAGRSIGESTLDVNSYNRHIYDWEVLKRWGVHNSNLIPQNSIIYNREANLFDDYKWYLLGVLLFLISQSILILYLFRLQKKQKAVTKQQMENEKLFRQIAREDRLSRMSELTASLSHELNQPLTAILYNAQAGKRFLASEKLDNKQALEIFDNIIEDNKRAGGLISSVRSLMKLETRKKEMINVNTIILETEKIFHADTISQHTKTNIKLEKKPVFVSGDKIQLQQVLLNLLLNAAHSIHNHDSYTKLIEVSQEYENGYVTVSVSDSGPGIDKSSMDEIFKPFITTSKEGMGIGLTVSRTIIEAHNGKIWARNLANGGAVFSFKLKTANGRK